MRHGNYSDDIELKFNWQLFGLVLPYLRHYRGRVAVALLLLVAAKIASVAGPFLLKHIVDDLDPNKLSPQQPELATLVVVPIALLLAYGLARFGNVLLGELRDTVFGRVTEHAMHQVGLHVFRHLHALDMAFHLNRRTGGLARDIERGTTGISFLMRFFVFNIAPTFIEIAMVAGLLFYNYGIAFAIIPLVSVIIYVLYTVKATEWRTRFVREENHADSRSNTHAATLTWSMVC